MSDIYAITIILHNTDGNKGGKIHDAVYKKLRKYSPEVMSAVVNDEHDIQDITCYYDKAFAGLK